MNISLPGFKSINKMLDSFIEQQSECLKNVHKYRYIGTSVQCHISAKLIENIVKGHRQKNS